MNNFFYGSMSAIGILVLSSLFLQVKANEAENSNALPKPDTVTQITSDSINMIGYEQRNNTGYESVLYMPYYPAYGMISFKSPSCSAELTGYIDPFSLKDHKVIITYKRCKVSFSQNDTTLSNPTESPECQEYHQKECNFTSIPTLNRIPLHLSR